MAWSYVVTENYDALTTAQMHANAVEFYNHFYGTMTLEAICGLLGNIQHESQLNPGQQERGYGGSLSRGYGLIQWTPASDLTTWASSNGYNWYDGTAQCILLNAECYNNLYDVVWIPTSSYSYTWDEFKQLTNVEEAVKAYLYERERAGVAALSNRIQYANEWYSYLSGVTPQPSFTPRTSLETPPPSPWYTAPDNWYSEHGWGYPTYGGNCTWYAYGRYNEARGSWSPNELSHNNAGDWYDDATAFNRGATPQLGAVICYHDPSGVNLGHVAVVEQINDDGSILISQSGFPDIYFWTATVTQESGYRESWAINRGYVCQGFIYNDISPTPPEPPEPEKKKKMPLWMMLKYF